jgi:hypothetical protein
MIAAHRKALTVALNREIGGRFGNSAGQRQSTQGVSDGDGTLGRCAWATVTIDDQRVVLET